MFPCKRQRAQTGILQQVEPQALFRRPLRPPTTRRRRVALFLVGVFVVVWCLPQSSSSVDYSTVRLGYESVLSKNETHVFKEATTLPRAEEASSSTTSSSSMASPAQIADPKIVVDGNQVPKNLRLVFIGDSLSRYMYLSLVYFLKHGTWAPRGHELLEKVKDSSPDAWNEWLAFTNQQLELEECDCYRHWTHPFQWYKHCENRYYHSNNHYVSFITKFGGNPFHGHVLADQVFQRTRQGTNQTVRHYDWVYPTWDGLVDKYIAHWNPKPDILVFNQGHWKAHDLRDEKVLKKLRRVLKKHGIRGIYRTTTFRQDERVAVAGNNSNTSGSSIEEEDASYHAYRNVVTRRHDELVCQYFDCLNVSWTVGIPTTDYVDPVHFKAPINNRMNQQFLREFVYE
jgi:hypothetical protein